MVYFLCCTFCIMVLHICKPNTTCVHSNSVCAHEASVDYTWEHVFNLNKYVYYFSKLRCGWIYAY